MATLTAKLSLSSSNVSTDNLSILLSNVLTVGGDYRSFRKIIASGASNLETANIVISNASYGKAYVLLHNTSIVAAEIITIGENADTNAALDYTNITLGAGEFAFYPWNSTVDLVADAASGDPVLEVMIFEAA